MSINRLESLFNIVYGLLYEKGIEAKKIEWHDLDRTDKKILDETMNGGIPRNRASYTKCEINGSTLCMAEFYDREKKFTAHYLVFSGEVIYSNEF